MKYSLGISNFLEQISSLSHSFIFLCVCVCVPGLLLLLLLFPIVQLRRFSYLQNFEFSCVYVSLLPLPFASLFSTICKASSVNHFAFLHFFFLGMLLVTTPCTMLWIFVHSSSCTVSTRSNPLNLFVTWYNHKGFGFIGNIKRDYIILADFLALKFQQVSYSSSGKPTAFQPGHILFSFPSSLKKLLLHLPAKEQPFPVTETFSKVVSNCGQRKRCGGGRWSGRCSLAESEERRKPWAKGCGEPLEYGKGKKISSLWVSRGNKSLLTPQF